MLSLAFLTLSTSEAPSGALVLGAKAAASVEEAVPPELELDVTLGAPDLPVAAPASSPRSNVSSPC